MKKNHYFIKTPWWLKRIYSSYTWEINTKEKIIYLSFDDGPHPIATLFVLDELKKYNASATFFCIGKNVLAHPSIYKRIIKEGHAIGNHTQHHLNGWNTNNDIYFNDIDEAAKNITSKLFRPPYGRIKSLQSKIIMHDYKIIMWSVLSGDFDPSITKEKCLSNVINNAGEGSIVVFHDSEKAFPLLSFALPETLRFFTEKGFRFEKLSVH